MIFAVADDLTGALETGAKFAGQGLPALVTTVMEKRPPASFVLTIDTETRHLAPSAAAARIRLMCAGVSPGELIYKKTDSTLRGNIAAELAALQEVYPDRQVFYVPAYPAMKRTVHQGELQVDGVPVHQTTFANDSLNPITCSSVKQVLGSVQATVFDGETDADVLAAAEAILRPGKPAIVAGPAAIAQALARLVPAPRETIPALPSIRTCLIINGSLHPSSRTQVDTAHYDEHWTRFDFESNESGVERALRLGESVKNHLRTHPVDALIVFGGDTAFGIHRAFGSPLFSAIDEVLPGVPVSRAGELYWITKAGGFGQSGLIDDLRRRLSL